MTHMHARVLRVGTTLVPLIGLVALSLPLPAAAAAVFPQQCLIVSDANAQEGGHNSVPVPLPVNAAWTANIPGATWIWGELLSDAGAQADKTEAFTKTFTVSGFASTTLDVAADNGYKVLVNGIVVDDQTANPPVDNFSVVHHVPDAALNAAIHADGLPNTLEIDVTNSGVVGSTALTNPAGLLFKMRVLGSTCAELPPSPPAPVPAHLTVKKHVINDGGGIASAGDFSIHVMATADGESTDVANSPAPGSETGTLYDLPPGDYTISEDPHPNYQTSYSGTCEGGHIHLSENQSVDCVVVNTYVPPPSCTVVSDASTQENGHDSAVLSFIHSAWTHLLDALGAVWIWGENGVTDPVHDTTESFTKVVHVNGTPTRAFIDFAADNGYQIRVNGTLAIDKINVEHNYEATTTLDILPYLTPNADNTIVFTVHNLAMSGGTPTTNPAGLIYAIHIDNGTCTIPDPHQTATVIATKIVCPDEKDLPNLAASSHHTGASTAADFLETHPSCHLAPDWQFEWGDQNAGNPGDSFIGPAPSGYHTSAATDAQGSVTMTVPLANVNSIHIREVLKDGFIPFSFGAHPDNSDTVSAELSCGDDGLNYDNWDFINSPQAGQTYYCVAYNAPQTGLLHIVKKVVGSDESPAHFSYSLDGADPVVFDKTGSTTLTLAVGVHTVTEPAAEGYTTTYEGCSDVTVSTDNEATCTITNTKVGSDTPNEGGGGPSQTFTFSTGGGVGGPVLTPRVLGESTTTVPVCGPLLTDFLHIGWKNDPDQVKKLQQFLNTYLGIHLPVNGVFGKATWSAVRAWQQGQWQLVLKPWIGKPGSGITSGNTPTGFVYQTTKWRINNVWCPGSEDFPKVLN